MGIESGDVMAAVGDHRGREQIIWSVVEFHLACFSLAHVQFWACFFAHLRSIRSFGKMTLSPGNEQNGPKFHIDS